LETTRTQSVTPYSLLPLTTSMSGHGWLKFRISLKFTFTPFKILQVLKMLEYCLSIWSWILRISFMPSEEDWLIIQLHTTFS
jgi:hypothetical protein